VKIEHAMARVKDLAPNPQQSPQEQEEEITEIINSELTPCSCNTQL